MDTVLVNEFASGAIVELVLNRAARRNAVDRATADALYSKMKALDENENVSVVILSGSGGCFCAGA